MLDMFAPSLHHRPGIIKALEEFKHSVYGEHYDEEGDGKASQTAKKRKAGSEDAVKESANYNWGDLADTGKVIWRSLIGLAVLL